MKLAAPLATEPSCPSPAERVGGGRVIQGTNSGLRIGLFTPNYPGISQDGGIGSHIHTLGRALTALGHRVLVITPGTGTETCDGVLNVLQVSTRHLPIADRIMPGFGACARVALCMSRLVRKHQLDIVEFPNWEGLGVFFQRLTRTPVVVRLYTSSFESQLIDGLAMNRARRWDVRRERWQSLGANAVVTHSYAHRQTMAKETGLPPERIRIIPLGISVFPDFQRSASRGTVPTIVYLGRLEKRKGTIDLLKSIPRVLSQIPDARFVLIGSDRAHCPGGRTHAQFLADEFPTHVQKQVQLLGRLPQSEVDRWLQTADVFVAPSIYESFGLVFPEAMRWGTPVIGTRVGGIPEIVTDGETGLLVEPRRSDDLAEAIVRMLLDRNLRERLGAAGRKHVETNFAVQRMAQATAELYHEVIRSASR